jgi:hypothetical protein
MPTKKAPSAKEMPNSLADPNATPSASASTASVNSSREPVPATRSSRGMIARRPSTKVATTNTATLPKVSATAPSAPAESPSALPVALANTGSSTNASTINRSSTISQPIAIFPRMVLSTRSSSSARSNTTVLATDSASPNTIPSKVGQPSAAANPQPRSVAMAIWTMTPGIAIVFTSSRSSIEKCKPTPNISRMTPISASSDASA